MMIGWALENDGELMGADHLRALPMVFRSRSSAREHKRNIKRFYRYPLRVVRVEVEWPRIVGTEKMIELWKGQK